MYKLMYKPRLAKGNTGEPCSTRLDDYILEFDLDGCLLTDDDILVQKIRETYNSLFIIEDAPTPEVSKDFVVGQPVEEKFEVPQTEPDNEKEIVETEPELPEEEMIELELKVQEKKEVPKLKLKLGRKKKK